jgi:ABC-2 type transport system ATP-binding protein
VTGTPTGVADAVVRFGARTALAGVSLTAEPGVVTAVVGGDGAGKTTLLRVLVGRVALDAGTRTAPDPHRIGFAPATAGSWAGLTVEQNLAFVGGSYGVDATVLRERTEHLLEAAGLREFRDRPAGQLSGGMRRKLGAILAMVHDPQLLVLDEPSTGVDPVSRVDLWRLAAHAAARGTTVVMSTSYLDEAERAAHVLVLDAGRTLAEGLPAAVVGAFPGTLTEQERPVRPAWAWRRGRRFRELWPTGGPPPDAPAGPRMAADLEDVVIARSLLALHGEAQAP